MEVIAVITVRPKTPLLEPNATVKNLVSKNQLNEGM